MKKFFNSLTKTQQIVVVGFIITGIISITTALITNISLIIIKQTDKKAEQNLNIYPLLKSYEENIPKEEQKSIPNLNSTTINEIWSEGMQEEWKLFIFAREAFKFKNSEVIVSEYNIYDYSKMLEEKILLIIKERYNNFDLDIRYIDDFLNMNEPSLEVKYEYILYEKYKIIDVRIKYAIFAYGYSQMRIYFGKYFNTDNHNFDINEYRAAKAAVFKLDEKDLENLLVNRNAFRLSHDDN